MPNGEQEVAEILAADKIQRVKLAFLGEEPRVAGGTFKRFIEVCVTGAGEWLLATFDEYGMFRAIGADRGTQRAAEVAFDKYIAEYSKARRPACVAPLAKAGG